MATTYDIGDAVKSTVTFTSSTSNSTGVDPSVIKHFFETPDGTVTGPEVYLTSTEITKDTTGVYSRIFVTTADGIYETRWTSTGTWATSVESWFNVRPQRVST